MFCQAEKKATANFRSALRRNPEIAGIPRIITNFPRGTQGARVGQRLVVVFFGWGTLAVVGPEKRRRFDMAVRFFWRRTNAFVREEHDTHTWPGLAAKGLR
jgi:hypothetical protein